MSQPHVNHGRMYQQLNNRTPIYDRVDKILETKKNHVKSITAQAQRSKREFMQKTQGFEHDDDVIEKLKKRKDKTPPQKLDENYFEMKYNNEIMQRKRREFQRKNQKREEEDRECSFSPNIIKKQEWNSKRGNSPQNLMTNAHTSTR